MNAARIKSEIAARESAMSLIAAELDTMTEGTECYEAEHAHFLTLFTEVETLRGQLN